MPLETLITTPDAAVPRPRSFLQYFSSSLGKHARNMFDLVIEPEDPFRIYSPGQTVKGHIVLTVSKGFDITHLVVTLHGYAKVYKHQILPGEGLPAPEGLVTGRGPHGFEYHGNGLASLFQNEQVLCGSGFLKKHVYKFAFEVAFPARSLPSTIDFERGCITYMLTATLTRPTTIGPTTTRSTKVKFRDCIDIESMYSPKSRIITLEPISRRGKVKAVKPSPSMTTQASGSAGRLTRNNTQNSTTSRSSNSIAHPPVSPAPSDSTAQTNITTASTQSLQRLDSESPTRRPSPQASDSRSNATSSSARTITATTELPRHGALPGDTLPIRVSITHTKAEARGMVIATLYRQGRVDMYPSLPLAKSGKDRKKEFEDVYPRSRTGLGGLYFATASPSSVFRKDLAQSSTMMIVNPATLTAEITTNLKVPDAAFPTIANVPGAMISFTYHIEVVVDLFGKLGETRLWPRLTSREPVFSQSNTTGNQLTSDWAQNILDTTQLRRTKSVITFEMSLVVGTQDSSRKRKPSRPTEPLGPVDEVPPWTGENQADFEQYEGYGDPDYEESGYGYYDEYGQYGEGSWYPEYPTPAAETILPPEGHDEGDEKTRLRRQEELLLPSAPPQDADGDGGASAFVPSAPVLLPESLPEATAAPADGSTTPSSLHPAASVASARSGETIRPYSTSPPPASPAGADVVSTDDKQELERRRLLVQASAPPTDDVGEPSGAASAPGLAPSAPALTAQDEYNALTLNHDSTAPELPQYRR